MLYPQRLQIAVWLTICATLVFLMVILGGAVRLTGSGLSMVVWQPIMGVIPPLGEAGWQRVFDMYKAFPEYQLVNKGMSLDQFKFIYWMEYLHRVLGRFIGLAFFLPFCFFLWRGGMPGALKNRLWLLFLLGACQGLMGWYMVKSGLVDDPHVSQYRLTAHLMLAVLIYAYMLRLLFDQVFQLRPEPVSSVSRQLLPGLGTVTVLLLLLMIATGGFMAGTRAGYIFNTWPLMGDSLVPDMVWSLQPWWRNFFENALTVQLVHRWLAILVAAVSVWYAISVLRGEQRELVRLLAWLTIVFVAAQVVLGIATLVGRVPPVLGVSHQGGALLLLGAVVALRTSHLRPLSV